MYSFPSLTQLSDFFFVHIGTEQWRVPHKKHHIIHMSHVPV